MIPSDLPVEPLTKNNLAKNTKGSPPDDTQRLRETALKLEATFLSEMLKSSGFGTQSSTFSESKDEDHFASFQRDAIAEHMVRAGGIGLAEHFFNSMMEAKRNG